MNMTIVSNNIEAAYPGVGTNDEVRLEASTRFAIEYTTAELMAIWKHTKENMSIDLSHFVAMELFSRMQHQVKLFKQH